MRVVFTAPATDKPTGGIANYFALAQLARDLGYDAVVASEPGLDPWWLEPDISREWVELSQLDLGKTDVAITPEWWYRYRLMVGDARIVPYCQNHTYSIKYPTTATWALSKYVKRTIGRDAFLVERALFPFWDDDGTGQRDGALIVPTKNAFGYVEPVQEALDATGIATTVVMEPVSADILRDLYNSHTYYLALSFPEGLDMMAQEAMACGCVVVGFEGAGRTDYLIPGETGEMAPDGDWVALVETVAMLNRSSKKRKALAQGGKDYIQRYRPDLAREQLRMALEALKD